jgi:hypothetical protein
LTFWLTPSSYCYGSVRILYSQVRLQSIDSRGFPSGDLSTHSTSVGGRDTVNSGDAACENGVAQTDCAESYEVEEEAVTVSSNGLLSSRSSAHNKHLRRVKSRNPRRRTRRTRTSHDLLIDISSDERHGQSELTGMIVRF